MLLELYPKVFERAQFQRTESVINCNNFNSCLVFILIYVVLYDFYPE